MKPPPQPHPGLSRSWVWQDESTRGTPSITAKKGCCLGLGGPTACKGEHVGTAGDLCDVQRRNHGWKKTEVVCGIRRVGHSKGKGIKLSLWAGWYACLAMPCLWSMQFVLSSHSTPFLTLFFFSCMSGLSVLCACAWRPEFQPTGSPQVAGKLHLLHLERMKVHMSVCCIKLDWLARRLSSLGARSDYMTLRQLEEMATRGTRASWAPHQDLCW